MLGLSPTTPPPPIPPTPRGHGPRVTLVLCFSTCNVTNKPELYTDQYKIINSSVVRHVQRENNLRGEKTCPLNKSYLTCMYVHNVLVSYASHADLSLGFLPGSGRRRPFAISFSTTRSDSGSSTTSGSTSTLESIRSIEDRGCVIVGIACALTIVSVDLHIFLSNNGGII